MKTKSLIALLGMAFFGLVASAQTPTAEQLNLLKSLPQDQQDALIQSVMGKSDGTGKKTDSKLSTPETVQQKGDRSKIDRLDSEKTSDGHLLRMPDEDPELRADDAVLIDLTLIDNTLKPSQRGNAPNAGSPPNGIAIAPNVSDGNSSDSYRSRGKAEDDLSHSYGRNPSDDTPLGDQDKARLIAFRDRVLRNNPYRLNRFGVLEIPSLPSIPLAGLTAAEATRRLSADPDLRNFSVKLSLLRLADYGEHALKPFGYDLFQGEPSTFAPVSDIQVPQDYVVGPGDTLNVQLYGNEPGTYKLTVGRDGRVNFPKLGPISVSGMPFESARAVIERVVAAQMVGSHVSITMGDLRSIRVFVLGEAEKPGSYTVSGLSTMTNALFVSGGVKKIGSLRNIELKRNGRLVTVLDLYSLLLHGDTSADRQLMPGDVIFIPPIGNIVSVDGQVQRPAIYELKGEKTVEQIIEIAGGLTPDADEKIVQMERILPSRLHEMQDINLTTAAGRNFPLANGDKIRVPQIRPTLENSVEIAGYVFRPGAFEYHPGMRLSDVLGSFDELRPNADRRYIMIRREIPPEQRVEVISANLERALAARGSAADPQLQPRDKIFVFDLSASRARFVASLIKDLELQGSPDRPAALVSIDGKVKAPGRYPLEPSMHVSDLIRAGGSLEDAAYDGEAELTRYAVGPTGERETSLIPVNLAAIRRGDPAADIALQAYDLLVIKPTPQWEVPGTIVVTGEVRFPGTYPIHRGETLNTVLHRAGGFTDLAFTEGAVFIREELKKREKDQLELLTNRMQSDLAALALEAIASSAATSNGGASSTATSSLAIGQQLVAQLRDAKPVGRLVINVEKVMDSPPNAPGDVLVRDGDKLLIPKKTQEITILGEVQSPTSHIFQAGLTRDDYIAKSGGVTQKADRKRIYVVRANGDVISGQRSGWFRRTSSVQIHPGDTIVVPLDTERVRALPLWQAVTTIIYNLAIAVLAINSVR